MRKVTLMFFLAIAAMCMTGCSDNNNDDDCIIVDWTPVMLWVELVDENGNDLLDPSNETKWYDGATITYRGKTYTAEDTTDKIYTDNTTNAPANCATRYLLPVEYGFKLIRKEWQFKDEKGFILLFGQIDGAQDMDEDLVITWPDGKQNTIHYHCSDHNYKEVSVIRWYALDGVRQESNRFVITTTTSCKSEDRLCRCRFSYPCYG